MIKQIEWKVNGHKSYWSDRLAFGSYYILERISDDEEDQRYAVCWGASGHDWSENYLYTFPDLEQAKVGAQKHFEKELGKYIE